MPQTRVPPGPTLPDATIDHGFVSGVRARARHALEQIDRFQQSHRGGLVLPLLLDLPTADGVRDGVRLRPGLVVRGAGQVYGTFAVVLGLLSWLYLQAQLTVVCAEVNVVRELGLYPRSLLGERFPRHEPSKSSGSIRKR